MNKKDNRSSSEAKFEFDIYRSFVLEHYMKFWGMPESRVISNRVSDNTSIEVYYFPPNEKNNIAHIATIGLYFQTMKTLSIVKREYFFALPADLGGASLEKVYNYLLDISAHTATEVESLTYPSVTDETKLSPFEWPTKAFLIDEPRGEHEEFEKINNDNTFHPEFLWVIPIYQTECSDILKNGIEHFDQLAELSEFSLVDVKRPLLC